MKTHLLISLKIFLIFTVLLGIAYPLLILGIAQIAFPMNANGSLIRQGNTIIGSQLIGQRFDSIIYFSSRPSAGSYNPLTSGGTNLGPTNQKLKESVANRRLQFCIFNQLDEKTEVPAEMLFASGSGLDPHISPQAALLQMGRIAKARNLSQSQKTKFEDFIRSSVNYPQFGLLGEPCVNVLSLNLELDSQFKQN